MKTAARSVVWVLAAGAAFAAFWCWLVYGLHVWPPDIVSGRETVLASVQSQSGERFKLVQFWGIDFYTTQLEHIRPDGSVKITQIDGDDDKRWKYSAELIEADKTLVVSFPDKPLTTNYRWDVQRFVAPVGREPFWFEMSSVAAK